MFNTVDQRAGLAATQFGATDSAISPLVFDPAVLSPRLGRTRFLDAGFTQIRGGPLYCFNKLRKHMEDANKIVLLTDGRGNLGRDPVPIADLFRRTTEDICAVGVAYDDTEQLLKIVGGDMNKILEVSDFFKLVDILEELVNQVCAF